jgi:hypothetical protein
MLKDNLYALDSYNQTAKKLVVSGMPSTKTSAYAEVVKLLPQARKLSESEAYQLIAAANSAASKAGAALPTGTYSDSGGYTYEMSPTSITIYKKSGAKWKTISSADSDWSTYSTSLARDLAAGNLKSGKAAPTASPAKTYSPAPSYAPPATTPPPKKEEEESITDKPWFWPAVAITTVAAVGGGYWFFFMRGPKNAEDAG